VTFCKIFIIYSEDLLFPCPNPKLDDHHLSVVRHSLFSIFPGTL